MLAQLTISLGGGHATINLDVSRGDGPRAGRRVGALALLLAAPMILLLGAQALGVVTGRYSLDRLLNAPGGPWVYLLTAGTAAVILSLLVVLVCRLRLAVNGGDGARALTVTLGLTILEGVAVLLAGGFVALFAVHLVADGLACARGVAQAC